MRISDWSSDVCSSDLAALDKLAELEAERARRSKTNKAEVAKQKEPRASTSDPQARVKKMADGGFRPAYNCQVATVAQGQIVVDVSVLACGSDRGLMRPMFECLEQGHGCRPRRHLVDGGFQIGRAHVRTPVTNAHLVCRLPL